uniref:Metalloendopeptidase n=1 Tax=Parastrongyloides trichosuri TaxID=131310 RepID=A0A0N4ZZM2_PARTI
MLLKLIFFISISLSLSLTKGELDDFTKNLIKTGTFVLDDDIHLSKRQIEMMKNEHHSASGRVKRVVSSLGYHQWTEFPIKYRIFKPVNETLIKQAIANIEKETCLTFEENKKLPKKKTNGLYFVNDGYCYGELGRSVHGKVQNVSITEECQEMGTILHEIGHALGMQHEHNRVDRDQHIYIDWDKIGQANQTHFYIENNTFTLNIKYDYGSAMHYVRRAGREKNGTETIYANITAYKYTMGQRNSFSFLDWKTLNRFY